MAQLTIHEKQCYICKAVKPLDEFYRDRGRPDGKTMACRSCMKAQKSAHYYRTHPPAPIEEIDNEQWRPVLNYSGYEVSNHGRVRSLKAKEIRLLRTTSRYGYPSVVLSVKCHKTNKPVHGLVLEAFIGPRPSGMQCCHGNGVRNDNRLTNLRWDTPKANAADKVGHGTSRPRRRTKH